MSKDIIKKLLYDIKNGTSHSVDYLLSNDVESTLSEKGIRIRQIISPALRRFYLTQTKYKLIREPISGKIVNEGKIFVINHRQADDIVLGANATKEHAYILFGNKDLVLETPFGLGLWANGVIVVDRDNKESRHAAYKKLKYVLEHGGNVIIFAEGYWNLDDDGITDGIHGSDDHNSECWLIQDINIGAIRLAKETGCPIIPTVLHYDEVGKYKCYSKKGKLIYVSKTDDIFDKKDEVVDTMNAMYYNLMDKYSHYDRDELESNGLTLREQWEALKEELIAACSIQRVNYKLDLLDEKRIGKAKVSNSVVTNKEAFEHLDRIDINSSNAYLLSKRLSGRKR